MDGSALGEAAINAFVRRVRGLSDLDAAIARECVRPVKQELAGGANAGRDPYGQAWAPRKKDGAKALPGAGEAIQVSAVADLVVCKVSGYYAVHQAGAGHIPRRALLPDDSRMPDNLARIVGDTAREVWARQMGQP